MSQKINNAQIINLIPGPPILMRSAITPIIRIEIMRLPLIGNLGGDLSRRLFQRHGSFSLDGHAQLAGFPLALES